MITWTRLKENGWIELTGAEKKQRQDKEEDAKLEDVLRQIGQTFDHFSANF